MKSNNYKVYDLNNLLKTTRNISKAKSFESISQIIFDFVKSLIKYDMAVIYNIDWESKELEVVSCRGSDIAKLKKRFHIRIGEGAVGWVAEKKKVLLIDDVLKTEVIQVRQFYNEDPTIRSFLSVPLIVGDELIGILSVSCSEPDQIKNEDVEMITLIASQGAALLKLNNEVNKAKRFSNYILENVNSGVLVLDNDYNIIVFNETAEKITGYSSEKVLQRKIHDTPLEVCLWDWRLLDSLDNGNIYYEEHSYLINKYDNELSIKFSTSLIKDDLNEIEGCICIFRDNTEKEKIQKQMIKTEKLATIGRLTSGITHEIRNPLLPIMTSSEFLISQIENNNVDNKKEIIKLLNIIHEESRRLDRFLDEISVMDKRNLNIGDKTLAMETFEETILLIRHSLKKDNIYLNVNYADDDFYLPLSKDELKQIFLNLLLNSIDAINEKKKYIDGVNKIKVSFSQKRDKALIEIIDTGQGIKKKNIDNVFNPFYSTRNKGTGLGLFIVNNIITYFGGEIAIESIYKQKTKISIKIPIVE